MGPSRMENIVKPGDSIKIRKPRWKRPISGFVVEIIKGWIRVSEKPDGPIAYSVRAKDIV